jgi:hypothetical protein
MPGFQADAPTLSIPRRPGVDVWLSSDRAFVTIRQQPNGSIVEVLADDVPTLIELLRTAQGQPAAVATA